MLTKKNDLGQETRYQLVAYRLQSKKRRNGHEPQAPAINHLLKGDLQTCKVLTKLGERPQKHTVYNDSMSSKPKNYGRV